jgi:hypothetical protein
MGKSPVPILSAANMKRTNYGFPINIIYRDITTMFFEIIFFNTYPAMPSTLPTWIKSGSISTEVASSAEPYVFPFSFSG